MSIVLLGAGQLARALSLISHKACCPCISLPRACYPLVNDDLLRGELPRFRPNVIINAAAYTDVAGAEKTPELAKAVNCDCVTRLAELAKQHNALLVHFSTDYVFGGAGHQPWRESDRPTPLNIYGQSKLAGERAILASGCRHLIIRTSWLHSPWRDNFLKTMLRLAQSCDELQVVCDQVGAPTSAMMLAEVTLFAVERVLTKPELAGLYHVAASGAVSWYDYARCIFQEVSAIGLIDKAPQLKPITSVDYGGVVKRPLNSLLETQRFQQSFGVLLPDWREGVTATLQALLEDR
ncbi:dTDP-4-dehydrorhamnose reductase [Aeromonas salmonicida]|uniref:dTDP-4-dehydrorhamnose reductase n=1 Tax=Aeromonas salmonicida TaxID=645 RepID=UPI003D06609A